MGKLTAFIGLFCGPWALPWFLLSYTLQSHSMSPTFSLHFIMFWI